MPRTRNLVPSEWTVRWLDDTCYDIKCPCGRTLELWSDPGREVCECGREYQMLFGIEVTEPGEAD